MLDRSPLYSLKDADETIEFIRKRAITFPKAAILAGTGLGNMTNALQVQDTVDYNAIPHFPASTVQSHAGRLVFGLLGGKPIVVLQGRFHLYEGYSSQAVAFPIRVLKALGVRILVLTNASGGLNPAYNAGDIMIISDHINLTGDNPLIGSNEEHWGPRFPDMTAAYDLRLQALARAEAGKLGLTVRQGVYAGLKGPSLETPAEMCFLRTIGADAVGFSTVMETIAAVHCGMQVLGLSTITNMCLPDHPAPAGVDEIIATAEAAAPRLAAIVAGVLSQSPGNPAGSEME